MKFADLELSEALLRAVQDQGYVDATPIQATAIPHVLAGQDILGCAQTGTGKTAAFALPTIQRLTAQIGPPDKRRVRCSVLAPTRELACQIAESFRTYGRHTGLRHAIIYGGVSQVPQCKMLQRGVDIIVATPGRLCDLMAQGYIQLKDVQTLILDEADQMLDLGFIHDLRRIVGQVPKQRQTLLFSATMAPEIRRLAGEWLKDPVTIEIAPQGTPTERVEQSVYFVEKNRKADLLVSYLSNQATGRTIVFSRTKYGADKLVRHLMRFDIRAEAIHGDKSQNARQQALLRFKSDRPPVLIATDIAARGLDIDSVSHVVNYDLPMTPELYVHRIGRTGRAGASGVAVMFCDSQKRGMLKQIERLTRQSIPLIRKLPDDMPQPTHRDGNIPAPVEPPMPSGGYYSRPPHGVPPRGRRPGGSGGSGGRPSQGRGGHSSQGRPAHGQTSQKRPASAANSQGGNYGSSTETDAERKLRLARRRLRRTQETPGVAPAGGPSPGYRGPKFKKRSPR